MDTPAASLRAIVAGGLCVGCGACTAAVPQLTMEWDRYGQFKPRLEGGAGDMDLTGICPFAPGSADEDDIARDRFPAAPHHDPRIGRHARCYVGHAAQGGWRAAGSSGGLVSWVAAELLARGLVDAVAHVREVAGGRGETRRLFDYVISDSPAAVGAGAKSRYYPVELSAVLAQIRARPGRYALVGVPCFIKAVQLLRRRDAALRARIPITLGLFCGHMKSARLAESFARQLGTRIDAVEQVDFRIKDAARPASWYRARLTLRSGERRERDWWHLVDGDWGAGFFQNSACDFCDDVVSETADIAFGDAWVEPYASDGRGTNVVVVRAPALAALIEGGIADGRLALRPVDAGFVAETQAAGFRQRREGLAYRLALRRRGLMPRKRVAPRTDLPLRRRLIYRLRQHIARRSHHVFLLARTLDRPGLFLLWAKAAGAIYGGLAYSRGPMGRLFDAIAGLDRRMRGGR